MNKIMTTIKTIDEESSDHFGANVVLVGLRPALEGFVVTMHEGACETGSQIPTV